MIRKLNVVVMGTTDFAVPALNHLVEAGHHVVACVCQPDRPNQRGKKIKYLPVKARALELGIPVLQPEKIKTPEAIAELQTLNADLFVVAAYGQILSQTILDMPAYGCINIHGSLLPAYRGAAPIHHAIMDGLDETGVTIMQMDAGMDTGDMLMKGVVHITETSTVGEIHDALAELGASLLIETIDGLLEGKIIPEKQDATLATYADKLDRDTGKINWCADSKTVLRQINGTTPFPGAYTEMGDVKIKCFTPEILESNANAVPGTILTADTKAGLIVKTADGAIKLHEIQMPGKKRMQATDYFRGNSIETGTLLGAFCKTV